MVGLPGVLFALLARHTGKAPKRSKPCAEGDHGSSVGMTRRGHARFICVSDAIGPAQRRGTAPCSGLVSGASYQRF